MLDTRLKMVYDLVPNGVLCDIGTDHAKLPVFAVLNGKAPKALACDVNKGPLISADANIRENGLSDKIKTVLSNGFLSIDQNDFDAVDCFVMAGMGGELIESIISAKKTNAYLVLQPQSAYYELLDYLFKNGYTVLKQVFCMQGFRHYNAMLVKYTGECNNNGYFVNAQKDDAFYKFIQKEKERVLFAVSCIEKSNSPDKARLLRHKHILNQLEREQL